MISLFSKPILAVVSILTATILLLAIGTTMIFAITPVHETLAAVTLGDQVQRTPLQSAISYLNDARQALEKNNTKAGLENLTLAQQQLLALDQGLAQNSTSAVMPSNEQAQQANQSVPTITSGQSSISGQSRRCDQLKGPSSGLCQ